MRVNVTISFDEEQPLGANQPWAELADSIKTRIEDDPAGYLDMALPNLSGDVDRHERGPIHVTVKPR